MRITHQSRWILALSVILAAGCGGKSADSTDTSSPPSGKPAVAAANSTPVKIAWAQWKPSEYLEELSKDFTAETGIPVQVEQIPWTDFQNKINTQVWAGKSADYDLIVGDSQWLGRGATEKHYVDLTEWSNTNVPWNEISPSAKQFYCEYDGRTWAVPCEADVLGFAYRKDLFEAPAEKDAFKAKYKRDLAPPKTWAELRDIAEFFNRPDRKLYGVAPFYKGGGGYDGVTMGFDAVLWSYGGDLHDAEGKVQGVINSPDAVNALAFYTQELKKFTPPGSENFYYDETLNAFKNGQVAMAMDWYTFFPGLTDESNPQLANTGFFVCPAGPKGHFISLGGQGLSLSAYSKNQDNAKKFLAWFCKRENQAKWAKLGGLTTNTEVLKTPDFQQAAPFNAAFAESVPYLKDFYNTPKYAELLDVTQTDWNKCATGGMTPKAAMDDIAAKHTATLQAAGSTSPAPTPAK